MNRSRSTWKDYFSFTKKERIAVFILLTIISVFVILPFFFSPKFKGPEVNAELQQQLLSAQNKALDNEQISTFDSSEEEGFVNTPVTQPAIHYFYFDPNTLDATGWKQLGLRDKTIQTIINYRNKGGHFRSPIDIKKIYGLKKEEAEALIPYIRIQSPGKSIAENKPGATTPGGTSKRKSSYKKININTATVEEWKSLPGIGDVLSNRIVKFRNAVHGFKSVEDIKKTYGLPDSTYQLILPYLFLEDSTSKSN